MADGDSVFFLLRLFFCNVVYSESLLSPEGANFVEYGSNGNAALCKEGTLCEIQQCLRRPPLRFYTASQDAKGTITAFGTCRAMRCQTKLNLSYALIQKLFIFASSLWSVSIYSTESVCKCCFIGFRGRNAHTGCWEGRFVAFFGRSTTVIFTGRGFVVVY